MRIPFRHMFPAYVLTSKIPLDPVCSGTHRPFRPAWWSEYPRHCSSVRSEPECTCRLVRRTHLYEGAGVRSLLSVRGKSFLKEDEPGLRLTYKSNASRGPHLDEDLVFRYSTEILNPSRRFPSDRTWSTAMSKADRIASLLHIGSSSRSVNRTAKTSCFSAACCLGGQCWRAVDAKPMSLDMQSAIAVFWWVSIDLSLETSWAQMTEIISSNMASINQWSFIVDPEDTRNAQLTQTFSSQMVFFWIGFHKVNAALLKVVFVRC